MSNPSKSFSWQEQLAVGSRGEALFAEYYPEPVTVFAPHKADFRRVSDGALIELKTDDYNLEKTENFFFERYGNLERTKPGGPWRARKDRVSVFVYYFVRHNIMFEFETKALCKVLEKLTKKMGLICVKSQGWAVLGWKVPIADVLEAMKFGEEKYGVFGFKHAGIDGQKEWKAFKERAAK